MYKCEDRDGDMLTILWKANVPSSLDNSRVILYCTAPWSCSPSPEVVIKAMQVEFFFLLLLSSVMTVDEYRDVADWRISVKVIDLNKRSTS
jgi:hypothetical protein